MTAVTKTSRARSTAAIASLLLLFAALGALAEPSYGQAAEPSIAFLNPSSFATAGERGIVVSDAKPDDGPGCCEAAVARYRLSAWVSNAPPGARVFFGVVQRAIDLEITATSETGMNTWEAGWSIPAEILDGPATLYAYLVLGEEPIAVDEQPVTIMRVQENAQLTYPAPAGAFGTYAALADELDPKVAASRTAPTGVVDALYTATPEMAYVRTFYTTTQPGADPKWKPCGTELIGTSNARAGNGVRCTLADAADQTEITAIAAVSNDSPDDYEARFNESGDAVPVGQPYAQELTALSFVTGGSQRVEREPTSDRFYCSAAETAQLVDQMGRGIPGANMDVHATGPSDSLKFDTFSLLTINQAPDRGPHATEAGFDCTGQRTAAPTMPPANANPDIQGEHQRFGFGDRKHIESLAGGTSDTGTFSFRLHATTDGVTEYTMWVDEADDGCLVNDDAFTQGELSVTGSIGWAQDGGLAIPQPFETLVPCVPGTPSPSPSEGPGETVDGRRSVSLRLEKSAVLGRPGTFRGTIDAVERVCERNQRVVLKVRKPGGTFSTRDSDRTDDRGRFSFTRTIRAPRDYRVVAPASGSCNKARSQVIRLRT